MERDSARAADHDFKSLRSFCEQGRGTPYPWDPRVHPSP